jgi:hypothetical protein
MSTLKEMVSGGKEVKFTHFRRNELWYITDCGFQFAVPADPKEISDASFQATEKAMLMMRYIRKQLDANEAGRKAELTA